MRPPTGRAGEVEPCSRAFPTEPPRVWGDPAERRHCRPTPTRPPPPPGVRLTCGRAPRRGGRRGDGGARGSPAAFGPTAVSAEPRAPPGPACAHHGRGARPGPRGRVSGAPLRVQPEAPHLQAWGGPPRPLHLCWGARGARPPPSQGPGGPPHPCFLLALRARRLVGNEEVGGALGTPRPRGTQRGSVPVTCLGLLLAARSFRFGDVRTFVLRVRARMRGKRESKFSVAL